MASIEGVDGGGTSDMDSHREAESTESVLEPDRENPRAKGNKNASPSKVPETPKGQEQVDPATTAGDGNAQSSLDTTDEVTGQEHPSAQTRSDSERDDTPDDDEESGLKSPGGGSLSSHEDISVDQNASFFNLYKPGHVPGTEPASSRRGDDPRGEPGAGPVGGRRDDHTDGVQGQQQEHNTPDHGLEGPRQQGRRLSKDSSSSSDSSVTILNNLGENTSDNEGGQDASRNISLPVSKMAQDTTDGAYKQNMPEKQPAFVIVNKLKKFMIKHVESGTIGLLPKEIKPGSNLSIDENFLEDDTGNIFEIVYSNTIFEYNQVAGEGVVKQSQVATLNESDKTLSKSTRNDFNKDDTLCDKVNNLSINEKTPPKTPCQDENTDSFYVVQETECTEENNSDPADPPEKTKKVFVKNQDVSADSRPENNRSDGSMDSKADINLKGIQSRLDNTGPLKQHPAPELHKRPTTADTDYTSSSQAERPTEQPIDDIHSTTTVLEGKDESIEVQHEFEIVFDEVFSENSFKQVCKDEHPDVNVKVQANTDENVVVVYWQGSQSQVESARDMWVKYADRYSVNIVSFKDVRLGEQFDCLSDILEEELHKEAEQLDENRSPSFYFYINEARKKMGICSDNQQRTDTLTNMVKKGLIIKTEVKVPADIEIENVNQKLSKHHEEMNVHISGIVEGQVSITGARTKVQCIQQSIENYFKEELKRRIPSHSQHVDVIEKMDNSWTFPNGHSIVVTNQPVDKLEHDLLVTMIPGDGSEATVQQSITIKKKTEGTSIKVAEVPIPQWQEGTNKEKETLRKVISDLMNSASEGDCFNLVFSLKHKTFNSWALKKLTKNIVMGIKEYYEKSQSSPTVATFACFSTLIYTDCEKVCSDALSVDGDMHGDTEDVEEDSSGATAMSVESLVEIKMGVLHEVETDVIVNSINKDLHLDNGFVSSAIHKAAGPEMQKEINKQYPKGIKEWDIIDSRAYGLNKCKMVLHGALGSYQNSPKSLQELQQFVHRCLSITAKHKYESIAFPALGTGNLKYPKPEVAKAMFAAVQQFVEEHQGKCPLKRIVFVMYSKDQESVQAFQIQYSNFAGRQTYTAHKSTSLEALAVGQLNIHTVHGKIQDRCSDVLIYLWEKDHMNHGKSTF